MLGYDQICGGLEYCTDVSVFRYKYTCGIPDNIGDVCATLKNIVKFAAFTQNTVNTFTCSLWNVVIVVELVNILVNFVVQLEVRTLFPKIYVLSNLPSPGRRESTASNFQNCNFLPVLPLKFVFH
jgi:hypothetical protein